MNRTRILHAGVVWVFLTISCLSANGLSTQSQAIKSSSPQEEDFVSSHKTCLVEPSLSVDMGERLVPDVATSLVTDTLPNTGITAEPTPSDVVARYREATEQGDAEAQHNIGRCE